MDPIRKQLRQRLELEQMLGADSLPRMKRLPPKRPRSAGAAVAAPEANAFEGNISIATKAAEPVAVESPPTSGEDVPARLAELEQEIRAAGGCCGLGAGRTNLVFGEGNPHATLVFVGEAPGADEDRLGRPFVGRAGQLLNDIIAKGMAVRREDVYIANVCKCRPPENRTPLPDEMAACLPYLLRQLLLIRPRVVVALGACAAQGLLQTTESVGRLRGQAHPIRLDPLAAETTPVVVTYHPAYLLRNYSPEARRKVWEDIQVAMKIAGIPIPKKK